MTVKCPKNLTRQQFSYEDEHQCRTNADFDADAYLSAHSNFLGHVIKLKTLLSGFFVCLFYCSKEWAYQIEFPLRGKFLFQTMHLFFNFKNVKTYHLWILTVYWLYRAMTLSSQENVWSHIFSCSKNMRSYSLAKISIISMPKDIARI